MERAVEYGWPRRWQGVPIGGGACFGLSRVRGLEWRRPGRDDRSHHLLLRPKNVSNITAGVLDIVPEIPIYREVHIIVISELSTRYEILSNITVGVSDIVPEIPIYRKVQASI